MVYRACIQIMHAMRGTHGANSVCQKCGIHMHFIIKHVLSFNFNPIKTSQALKAILLMVKF